MNDWRIIRCGEDTVTDFAVSELKRYIRTMDPDARVDVILWREGFKLSGRGIMVGINEELSKKVPEVKDAFLDDAIAISVCHGNGYITGSNTRSVLIAVYRFLREVGCSFVRPGPEGEVIPRKNALDDCVEVCEAASLRHRCMVSEGAETYEHVADLIDWLPKNAMNSYFTQFDVPEVFYKRWYEHWLNPNIEQDPITYDEIDGMTRATEIEIHRRGLIYHAIGHGWAGIDFLRENDKKHYEKSGKPLPDYTKYPAFLNGKREPGVAQLCYSNPLVRESMENAIVDYCLTHPKTDYVCVWLEDGVNNHCECEECQKMIPSDWYITILNELDEKMTDAGLKTRVGFCAYVDLLWAPEKCRIKNPDRFLLTFAPISRTFANSFKQYSEEEVKNYPMTPYVRNKLPRFPAVEGNLAYLRSWLEVYDGDILDFDYHLMWGQYFDPSFMQIARTIHNDMTSMHRFGLNGLMSCQEQRNTFPSGIAMECMARGLWNREEKFEDVCKDYFNRCYGTDGGLVHEFFKQIEKLFDPAGFRCGDTEIRADGYEGLAKADKEEEPKLVEQKDLNARMGAFRAIPPTLRAFKAVIDRNLGNGETAIEKSWKYLSYYLEYAELLAGAWMHRTEGNMELAEQYYYRWVEYVCRIEPEIHRVFEIHSPVRVLKPFLTVDKK